MLETLACLNIDLFINNDVDVDFFLLSANVFFFFRRPPCPTLCQAIFFVGCHIGDRVGRHVHLHVDHHNVLSTLCEG